MEPIEYIFADHCRQMDMCCALEELAERTNSSSPVSSSSPDSNTAHAILVSLENDLNMHIVDEEMDLFPHLSARTLPEDHFPELLRLLSTEHERDHALVDEICNGLRRIVRGDTLKNPEQFHRTAGTFAEIHLSHLNWENAVVLPLARRCLTGEELKSMGRTM
ncbi:MAG: hemerythrin domain-containing protein, partial [Sphingomonadales bacterium]|nr:hemerythrin domain-containing protein [Sphingomonadales bacterium]